jgi:hypothetical protein
MLQAFDDLEWTDEVEWGHVRKYEECNGLSGHRMTPLARGLSAA